MPNQPRVDNPRRSVRVEDDLWHLAEARAEAESRETGIRVTVSGVIRDALTTHLKEDDSDT